jgi:hypothetical protein
MAIFAVKNFTNIQRETSRLVDELSEKDFIPNSSIAPRSKGLPLRYARTKTLGTS